MSVDTQDLARTSSLYQQGVANQMWPVRVSPVTAAGGIISLNSPFEVSIMPCDSLWLPITYDKSYGVNPAQKTAQTVVAGVPLAPDPALVGYNFPDLIEALSSPTGTTAAIVGLRFNTPNNPWLLWTLGMAGMPINVFGSGGTKLQFSGGSTAMRSISGPITRLWVQYYRYAQINSVDTIPGSQLVFMSMLGYSQISQERQQPFLDNGGTLPTSPPITYANVASGGYQTPQLNTLDQLMLGERGTAKPTVG